MQCPNKKQSIFAKSKVLENIMEIVATNKIYSIEDMDALINSIKSKESLTEEQIAEKLGYNSGYISQVRSRGEVSVKFINTLKLGFVESTKDIAVKKGIEPKKPMTYTPITTSEKVRIASDSERDLVIAQLRDRIARLEKDNDRAQAEKERLYDLLANALKKP